MKQPCLAPQLPPENLDWRSILPLVGRANNALARYDGMLQALPNPGVLLSPITVNEAVLSSKIEGTQVTLDQVLEAEAGLIPPEASKNDIEEISNYRNAVRIAEQLLTERPLTLSLIREMHQRLLQGVRGKDKEPGKFRSEQNWIGKHGDKIENARFVPPSPYLLQQGLNDWLAYLHLENEDAILQTTIAHAQFEILHPFKDGNGRMGRILIPLILYNRRALSRPMFYMSEYLEENRYEYYDRLLAITDLGDWQGWVEFFLNGIINQAENNLNKVQAILSLYTRVMKQVVEITHSQFAMASVDSFFKNPIISSTQFMKMAGFNSRVTANDMLRQLEEKNIITMLRRGAGRTPATYALPELINLTEGKAVFNSVK
jgi:Fic family protein